MATRAEKHPETETYIYYNANPRGRVTEDCVARALSKGLEMPYNDVVMELAKIQIETGYQGNGLKGIGKLLENHGWVKHRQPRRDDGTKYTGNDLATWLSINAPNGEYGNVICSVASHMICIAPTNHGDGINCRYKIHDTWNSGYKCIGNFWTRGDCLVSPEPD